MTGDVDLPAELLEAHADGKLVLFVGAGASMGDPSNLPSFRELVRQLADAARVEFDESVALDLFLGSMPEDFDTHGHAQRIIARPGSSFNPTHVALVRLASASGCPRIVTTNFDDHLTAASEDAPLSKCDVWVGPALPLGDDFSGIVHLHGSVLRPPAQMVLTDRDFGRAYLTDAWATRFLLRMFDAFTVLFVGYSHDDPIMRYVALGLPSKTRRYVLTHLPSDDKWRHLGIVPVQYSAVGQDHSALLAALEEWDRRARMGRLDHQTRMRDIINAGHPLNPVDKDYVRRRVEHADGAREFARFATSVDWLRWAQGVESFKRLFNGGPDTEASSVLGDWFGSVYVADPTLHGAALQTVQRLGQRFSPRLHQSLSWAAKSLTAVDTDAGRRWTVILATSIGGICAPPELGRLLPYRTRDQGEELALLRQALRPFLVLTASGADDDPLALPYAKATWHADDDVLTRHVLKLVDDRRAGDPALGTLLEDALGSAYDLLTAYHGEDGYDSLGWHRSAIEPHPQDEFRQPVDALIDGLRDYGIKALPVWPELPDRWWMRGSTLFRRLAVHLMESSSTVSTNEKLEWILDKDVLFEWPLKHEVFRLIASTVPQASPDLLARLLMAATEGPKLPDDIPEVERRRAYSVYNLLVWLTQSDPSWAEAQRERERLEKEKPIFLPREFPDLNRSISGGARDETLPMEIESFVQDLGTDPEAALTTLLNIDYSERRIDGPTWSSALSLVQQAVERKPGLGQRLWDAVESRSALAEKKDALQNAIIGGWGQADLGELLDDAIWRVFGRADELSSICAIASFLVTQIEKHLDSPESEPISSMRKLARAAWEAHKGTFESPAGYEPSLLALNSWPGDLARYWILEVNRRLRELGEAWNGLNSLERETLEAMLAGPAAELDAIRPALGGQAYFLFAADPAFAQQHILPLFEGLHAAQAWEAYLYNPRRDDRMLAAGFLRSVITEWEHLGHLGERGRHEFYRLVASIVSLDGITPGQRQQLLDQSVLADNGDHAAGFASAVLTSFKDDKVDSEALWNLWAREHLCNRILGLPRNARHGELERWADIAPFVGRHADEAFSMLSGLGIALGDGYQVPEWPADLLATRGAALVTHLAERIRKSNPAHWETRFAVQDLIDKLTASLGDALSAPLTEAATDAGFHTPGPTSG